MNELFSCERFIVVDDAEGQKQEHKAELETGHSNQLLGKAVLLIGNDTDLLQNLVTQLSRKGADIVLLCWQMPLEIARKLQKCVQSFGQQLLLIERVENQRFSVEQLIHKVITDWGHFDFFIDVSSSRRIVAQNNAVEKEPHRAWLPPKWQLTQMILKEMAGT